MLVDLLSTIKQSTKKSDVFFMGYVVGLIQRAETEMADDKQAKLDLALGIIGAVVNGFSPAIVVSGTLGTIALGAVATEIQNGKSLWEVISRQVARRFNSDTFLNALFIDGRVMGWQ